MLFVLFLLPVPAASQTADLVVANARVYTADPAHPRASAIAVRGGRILAVGDDVSAHVGAGTRRVDARGATVVPGFIDSHGHMAGLGASMEMLDLRRASSVGRVAELVRKEAAGRKPGEWILGRGWDQSLWGGVFPTHAALSEAAPGHPVCLTRVDGHAAWVNRRALEIAGITASTPDPPGGKILRAPSGEPTGILIDRAQDLVNRRIPPASAEQVRRHLERAAGACARLGITTVHDAGVGPEEIAAYKTLIRDGKLPIRIYAMIGGAGPLWDEWLRRGPEIGERLTIRSIKLLADGALGSRGAALLAPYSDDPGNTGLLILGREQIERVARQALEHGFQVSTHAIGDRANRVVLQAYAAVLQGNNDRRFRIEHAQVVAPEDFELFAKYSVIAAMQATHATSDMRWAEARLGPERVKGAYAWRRLLSLGVPLANGSDFPVEEPNPLRGFYAAVTRQDESGRPAGGWFPGQRMSREEALQSWTLAGAYAAFEEKIKGSLAPGKLADFVMLSEDIMTAPPGQILKARVLMTVVDGKVVYEP
jgi:predicted amidohydrolase YtcJ